MYSEEQLERHTEKVLREIGIEENQTILDCCCGSGIYTTAAAELVGEGGSVYAVDTNSEKLKDLRQKVDSVGLQNIEIMEENVESKISLPSSSVDVVLLYDIFWYFRPTENKLARLLQEVYRVAKVNALISVYPAHLNLHELKQFKNEMENKGFSLEDEYSSQFVHEGRIEKGKLLNFKKTNNQVKKFEKQIADLKARLPAHSVSPSMIEKLEKLEEELEEAKKKRM